ncbi:MAG: GIY-YIG nuclease family protein [Deltaproteobacteria bacterium]|nr:GIY-YIG nuclease family protein [Deltaproteobacteria bacterium]
MAKSQFTDEDDVLLNELGIETDTKNKSTRTSREERIIAGFEDIERFFEQHGRAPNHGEDRDIFERLYAVRLDKIRESEECRSILSDIDKHGLLSGEPLVSNKEFDILDDEKLLAELGVLNTGEKDVTNLKHVKTRAEIKAAEEIAQRTPCLDFKNFKPLFIKVQAELKSGVRKTRQFKNDAQIKPGDFFILGGQKVYVAEVGEEYKTPKGEMDARLRVVYDNGTESNLLRRSLQRALYKDEAGRRITDPTDGPLFSDVTEEGDVTSGTIYVLRSKLDHPQIKENQNVIHKIGVTSGKIEKRIADAKNDPTFLMADVEVIASYELSNINCTKLENLIHKFFEPARLDIEIKDRFGKPIVPREWYLVPLFIIDEVVEKIKDGSIVNYCYVPSSGKLMVNKDLG